MKAPALSLVSGADVSTTHVIAQNTSDHAQTLRSADGDTVSIMPGSTVIEMKFKHEFDPVRVRFRSVLAKDVTGVRRRPVTLRHIDVAQ